MFSRDWRPKINSIVSRRLQVGPDPVQSTGRDHHTIAPVYEVNRTKDFYLIVA